MSEQRYTVLIVDDEKEIIDLLEDHFKKRNCEAIATQDPAAVVDKLKRFSVKLMLLDLKMRNLDGFGVLEKIRHEGIALPPTIIITGFLAKYEDRLKEHGISKDDVITKPFDFDAMERAINRKLGHQIVTSEVGSEYEDKIYRKNRCRLGFVEDEQDLLKDLGYFFEERNYKVSCFSNAVDALRSMKKEPVDIVFVDIKLPGMQGDELMAELKTFPRPPVMIPMSADPLLEDMEKKLKGCGCKNSITKPFDIVELIELVKTIAVEKELLG